MSTEAEFRPQIVPGGGRDDRERRKKESAKRLWEQGMALLDSDPEEAMAFFLDANDEGMALSVDESRVCVLTGTVALGYARVPGTAWDADIAISHGRDEQRPTAFDRYAGGWKERDAKTGKVVATHGPTRTTLRMSQASGRPVIRLADAMGLVAALGLDRDGAQVRVEYNRDGVVELHPETVGVGPDTAGPRPLAD